MDHVELKCILMTTGRAHCIRIRIRIRIRIYIYIYLYITFRRKATSQRSDFKFHVYTIIRLQILHLHSNSFKDHSNTLGERAILSSTKGICSCVCIWKLTRFFCSPTEQKDLMPLAFRWLQDT